MKVMFTMFWERQDIMLVEFLPREDAISVNNTVRMRKLKCAIPLVEWTWNAESWRSVTS